MFIIYARSYYFWGLSCTFPKIKLKTLFRIRVKEQGEMRKNRAFFFHFF